MDEERSDAVNSVIKKGLALLVGMAVVIAVVTFVLVHALGLNDTGDAAPGPGPIQPASPLPTSALNVPGQQDGGSGDDSGNGGSNAHNAGNRPANPAGSRQLRLSATPAQVSPMGRINLTGTYGHKDNVSLEVQRWENGVWADFPVSVDVSVGTFATYVESSQIGVNRFRVFDPSATVGSNVVRIQVQ